MASLRNQTIAVIGGSSGIGFAVASAALAEGAAVLLGSSSEARVADAVERLGDGASGRTVDVTDEGSVAAFFDGAPDLDHLVFTAGDWGDSRAPQIVAELDLNAAAGVFGVRFWGAVRAIKHASARLRADGSVIVTNGSIAHRPRRGAAISSAMAGAIEHLVRALAVDLAPLRVNCICPGYVVTEAWDAMPTADREAFLARATERQPLPRAADPAEIAEAYLYLMRGTYSTGQVLIADGGMTLV